MHLSIAIDVMGGDYGIKVTVPASIEILQQFLEVNIILVGNEVEIKKSLSKFKLTNHPRLSILNAKESVGMDESPQSALKNKKGSSMRLAINLVKSNNASACVSAGNTGALMATARFVLKMLNRGWLATLSLERVFFISTSFPTRMILISKNCRRISIDAGTVTLIP